MSPLYVIKREGVKVFHRVDLEHRQGEFKGWCKDRREAVIRESHALIKKYTERGLGAAVIASDFDLPMPDVVKGAFGGPYGWPVHEFMVGIGHWARDSNQKGFVQYVFEKGAEGRHQVERMFSVLYEPPAGLPPTKYDWCTVVRINGWSFVPKYDDPKCGTKGTIQLQSADWFAYEVYKHMDNRIVAGVRKPVRKSASDLFRPGIDVAQYWDVARINRWVATMIEGGFIKHLEDREQVLIAAGHGDLI